MGGRRVKLRLIGMVASVAVIASGLLFSPSASAPAAQALSGSQFDPGFIIHDAQFFNSDAMSEAEIQAFLASKSGACANTNCLDVYRQTTFTRDATNRCGRYQGGSLESAARIIYKVQVACGISAKVILATLQKEQGLVTHTNPTDGRLRIAMGYGCPDTAPCDSLYYGFYNQVYSAASQFQRYRLSPSSFRHKIGVQSLYLHPNSFLTSPPRCGSITVNIRNSATAALYNYTPYAPNAAALNNLYGTGDSCSSYGNRNFWRFFSDWFGDPTLIPAEAAIAQEYTAEGGASGPLGRAVADDTCSVGSTSCLRRYEGGTIYWGQSAGAGAVLNVLDAAYRASGGPGGPLGFPTSNHIVVNSNPNGLGSGQHFDGGTIYSSAQGTFPVLNAIRGAYWAVGSNSGPMGWPTGVRTCASGVCHQPFQGGGVFETSAGGASVDSLHYEAWKAAGASVLGRPVGPTTNFAEASNSASVQNFERGATYARSGAAFAVPGSANAKYQSDGGPSGDLGWPTTRFLCASGICSQLFDGGALVESVRGVYAISSEYLELHQASGGTRGVLGVPRGDKVAIDSANGDGAGQTFERGTIYEGADGPVIVAGAMRDEYNRDHGSYLGPLGWPRAGVECSGGTCQQEFQHGRIIVGATGAFGIRAKYAEIFDRFGGPQGFLGLPRSEHLEISSPNGRGSGQTFQNGTVYEGPAGPIAVIEPVRAAYQKSGSYNGTLGWPTAAEKCVSSHCEQTFQGGTLYRSGSSVWAVPKNYDAVYRTNGGPAGFMGLPTGNAVSVSNANGAGGGQQFAGATIYSSKAGVFVVSNPVRAAYWAAGSNAGRYGWPTGAVSCSSGRCSQAFQGGVISARQ